MWETAGSLQDGKRVWMLARIPKTVEVVHGDEVKPYALLCNGHDGGLAVHILPTTVRVLCNNTFNLALNQGNGKELVIRHSQSLRGKIELAKRHLGIIGQRVEAFQHEAHALARVSLKETEARGYFERFFPTRTKPNFSDGAALLSTIVGGQQDRSEVVRDLLAGHFAETERIAQRNQTILEQILDNFERDPARHWGPFKDSVPNPETSAPFLFFNTNKRSVVLDQRDPRAAPGWPSFCPEPTCAWSASPAARLPVVNSIPTRCAPSIRV